MIALIDGDMVAFRCAASAENELLDVAILRADLMMRDILQLEDEQITFISGLDNFRYKINPEYKANRKDTPRPKHLPVVRDFLLDEYKAIKADGCEADDMLGCYQDAYTEKTTIFSNDKDLLMIPGSHYNPIRKEYIEVDELEALKVFYKQMLIGDVADNIRGVDKIGKVRAAKLIDPLKTEKEMYDIVSTLYGMEYGIEEERRFWMNADCLWLWRRHGEKYTDRQLPLKI